jgi:hypothetical protein
MSTLTRADVHHMVSYHPMNDKQREQSETIRNAAEAMINTIRDNSPTSADQSAAIRKVREALMTANSAIANEGRY